MALCMVPDPLPHHDSPPARTSTLPGRRRAANARSHHHEHDSNFFRPPRAPGRKARPRGRCLPYLLSLPALLVCIAILVPFVTAAIYSLQRYRLNLPYLRGFIGVDNYIDFLSDPAFWNTLRSR